MGQFIAQAIKPAIRSKRRGAVVTEVILQKGKIRPHVAKATLECSPEMKFEVLLYPSYSPDLVPSDFHMFSLFKSALMGCKLRDDRDVQNAVHN